jgi:AcrR family transcriptional regulator
MEAAMAVLPEKLEKNLMGTRRRLTPLQQARKERLLLVAAELASEGGYDAITMRDVAIRANVGLATLYRYFNSKDHLLREAAAQRGLQVLNSFELQPPEGNTRRDRMTNVFSRVIASTASDLKFSSAGVSALISEETAANSLNYWQNLLLIPFIRLAVGEQLNDLEAEISELLGHVFFSLMVAVSAKRMTAEEASAVMERAIGRLILD